MSIHVISDSTCDLPEHIKKELDIRIIPLHVRLGDDDRLDGVTITPDEIYSWSDQTKETPKTAAPSPEEVMNLMKDVLKDDPEGEIIAFSISDVLSASGNIMRMAAEELDIEDRVHVVNSKNLSIGVGILAMTAAKGAKEGKSVDEILKEVDDLIPRLRVSFVLDTEQLQGQTLVVFEKLYAGSMTNGTLESEVPIAVHEDLEDKGQTIEVPIRPREYTPPHTGDETNMWIWGSVGLLSGIGTLTAVLRKRKRM